MKSRLFTLFLALFLTQGITAQLTSLGLVEESDITSVDKGYYMYFIPELSFEGDYLGYPQGAIQVFVRIADRMGEVAVDGRVRAGL